MHSAHATIHAGRDRGAAEHLWRSREAADAAQGVAPLSFGLHAWQTVANLSAKFIEVVIGSDAMGAQYNPLAHDVRQRMRGGAPHWRGRA